MKLHKFLIFTLLLFVFFTTELFAENIEQLTDWNEECWNSFVKTKDYDAYKTTLENKIEQLLASSENVDSQNSMYNILVSEAFFYSTFVSSDFFEDVAKNQIIYDFILKALENQNQYTATAFRYFLYMANTSLFSKYGLGKVLLDLVITPKNDFEIDPSLPSGIEERIALLRAIAEMEALNTRFLTAQIQSEGELRFSDEAFIKVTQKPVLNYVLKNEPSFITLYDSYNVTKEEVGPMSFGTQADLYYALEKDLITVFDVVARFSLSTKEIVTPFTNQFLQIYYTNPFILTQLNIQQLEFISADIEFLKQISNYAPRFVDLLKKAE